MEIFTSVVISVVLAFIAGAGAFCVTCPNGKCWVVVGVIMFVSACYLESLVIESLPQGEQVKYKCIQEVKQ